MIDVKLWLLYNNTWNHFTVGKKSSDSFKNYKVRIKGKVEQSREKSNAFSYTSV